jgi:predicted RNase H-like HicB family nuclease
MSIVRYAAVLEAQPEGGFTVTFPDIPEAITEGDTREEALFQAADVLTLCLDERMVSGDALPVASKVKGGVWIEPAAAIQAAMAVRVLHAKSRGARWRSWRARWARRGRRHKSWKAHAPIPPSSSLSAQRQRWVSGWY